MYVGTYKDNLKSSNTTKKAYKREENIDREGERETHKQRQRERVIKKGRTKTK